MLNDIMDAVTRRLNELFGDGYEIYTDAVEQGLKEPCFFVQFLEPSEKPVSYTHLDVYKRQIHGWKMQRRKKSS